MGYSLSERAFTYAQIYLDELLESDQDTFTWEIEDSRDFARRLRQGISCAKKLGKEKYMNLLDIFQFKEKPNQVIAVRRVRQKPKLIGIHKKAFHEITNLSGLVTTALMNSHLNVLHFPEVNLSEDDKAALSKFCRAKGWMYSLTTNELQKCQVMTEKLSENLTN